MLLATVTSKNDISIRLTDERWFHITTSHQEINPDEFLKIMDVIENPLAILKGDTGELLAVKKEPGKKLWIVVAYKEVDDKDGFVLTAYLTTDSSWLFQKEVLWNKR